MAYQQKSNSITAAPAIITGNPAYLFIGNNDEELYSYTLKTVQKTFCLNNGCLQCAICKKIAEQQHPSIIWLSPEKSYTREELEPIFHTISFALEPDNHFFFVLQKADFLNQSAANSLLKILEEPPHGYHFILLATRQDVMLPTIRSRCLIKTISTTNANNNHEVLNGFMTLRLPEATSFLTMIDRAHLSDRESLELLNILHDYWLNKQKEALQNKNDEAIESTKQIITILNNAFEKPPMPGSSKLFWSDLYLQFLMKHNF